CFNRLGGLDLAGPGLHDAAPERAKPGEVVLTSFSDRRDPTPFFSVYQDPDGGVYTGPPMGKLPGCTGPGVYKGHDGIKADLAPFKAALKANGVEEGFMTSVAPASASRLRNVYYKGDEEFMYAVGEAMREEYKTIVDAGLILQLDDPAIAENWDMVNPEPSV